MKATSSALPSAIFPLNPPAFQIKNGPVPVPLARSSPPRAGPRPPGQASSGRSPSGRGRGRCASARPRSEIEYGRRVRGFRAGQASGPENEREHDAGSIAVLSEGVVIVAPAPRMKLVSSGFSIFTVMSGVLLPLFLVRSRWFPGRYERPFCAGRSAITCPAMNAAFDKPGLAEHLQERPPPHGTSDSV